MLGEEKVFCTKTEIIQPAEELKFKAMTLA
jgi:hypothetical protein